MRFLLIVFYISVSVFAQQENFSRPTVNEGGFCHLANLNNPCSKHDETGPCAFRSIFNYYEFASGDSITYKFNKAGKELNDTLYDTNKLGGFNWKFHDVAPSRNFEELNLLKKEIHKRAVPIIPIRIDSKPHIVTFSGYDETKKVVYLTDPLSRKKEPYIGARILSYHDFSRKWSDGKKRWYISTNRSSIDSYKFYLSMNKREESSKVLEKLQKVLRNQNTWGVTEAVKKGLPKVHFTEYGDVLERTEMNRLSNARKYLKLNLEGLSKKGYTFNCLTFYQNKDYISFATDFDKGVVSLTILERKTGKIQDLKARERELFKYLPEKVGIKYKLNILLVQVKE